MQENHPARSRQHQEKCKYCTSSTTGRGTDRKRCKESASVIGDTGRRSATSAQPGDPKEPGLLEVVGDSRSGERGHCVFYPIFENDCHVKEHDFARMSEDVEATIWRLQETIRVAELSAMHRLGQMRRIRPGSETSASIVLKRPPRWMKNALAPVPAPFQTPSSMERRSFPDAYIHRTNLHLK